MNGVEVRGRVVRVERETSPPRFLCPACVCTPIEMSPVQSGESRDGTQYSPPPPPIPETVPIDPDLNPLLLRHVLDARELLVQLLEPGELVLLDPDRPRWHRRERVGVSSQYVVVDAGDSDSITCACHLTSS